ncbi:Hypothetical protein SCF082_LOCUS51200 [Durusdinium trenchii]|uniref:Uncharacterized protein n=1 Tax=Durusdinium trenchii TaxID=1381693 RepID=A0ABP0SD97_9DINO
MTQKQGVNQGQPAAPKPSQARRKAERKADKKERKAAAALAKRQQTYEEVAAEQTVRDAEPTRQEKRDRNNAAKRAKRKQLKEERVGEAEGALDSIAKHTEEAASDLEHRTKEVVDDIKKDGIKVIKDLSNATKKVLEEGEASADQGVKEATDAAREGAIKVVKGLVFRPNTLTTTVAPLRLTPAPVALPYQHFLSSGASMLLHSVLYWLQPVVTDLLLISLAFLIFELTMSLGRHGHRYHQGSYGGPFGLLEAAGNVCMELWSGWTFGLAILVALWVVGILFAKELRTSAEPFQAGTPQAASLLLGLLCATLSVYFLVASWRWKAVNDHADIEAPRLELTRNVEEEEGPPSSRGPSEAEDDKPLLERPER